MDIESLTPHMRRPKCLMPMKPAGPDETLHSIFVAAGILCVRCAGCGKRAALRQPALDIHEANMQTIASLRLRCIACGSGRVACAIPDSEQEAMAFVAGR